MICSICRGAGSLLGTRWGLQWWPCPACGGAGCQAVHGPARVICHRFNTPVEPKKLKGKRP